MIKQSLFPVSLNIFVQFNNITAQIIKQSLFLVSLRLIKSSSNITVQIFKQSFFRQIAV